MTNGAFILRQSKHYYKLRSQVLFCSSLIRSPYNYHFRTLANQNVNKQTEKVDKDTSRPYKFTTSPANTPIVLGHNANKYQSLIVASSLLIFMIYFFYLREENDLDELIYQPIKLTGNSGDLESTQKK